MIESRHKAFNGRCQRLHIYFLTDVNLVNLFRKNIHRVSKPCHRLSKPEAEINVNISDSLLSYFNCFAAFCRTRPKTHWLTLLDNAALTYHEIGMWK